MSGEAPPPAELEALLDRLLELTRLWARGAADDGEAEEVRREAIRRNHVRYLELVPVYRHLAREEGLTEQSGFDAIVEHALLADDVFKSYRPEWIESRAFDRMTAWLGDRFIRRLHLETDLDGVAAWKARLKEDGVYLAFSSGTSGRLSFVPRDRRTLEALMRNGQSYPHAVWSPSAEGRYGAFDSLILGGTGAGMGLQSAGSGLARMARRSHFLMDFEIRPEEPGHREGSAYWDAAYERSLEFLRGAADEGVRILIFGAPFQVQELCERIAADPGLLAMPPGSLLLTGGGWKAFDGRRVPRERLWEQAGQALAIPADHIIDTYSTTELNCVFMTCSQGHYHIPPLVEPVVLDEAYTGRPGTPGRGILGLLDPFALSYPGFIVTQDQVDLARGVCACGLAGWHLRGEIHRAPGVQPKGCGGVMAAVTA